MATAATGYGGSPKNTTSAKERTIYGLKEAFELQEINGLPIAFDIAWYEQKAAVPLHPSTVQMLPAVLPSDHGGQEEPQGARVRLQPGTSGDDRLPLPQ